MFHTTTPYTVAHNNIIHASPLLYDRDDARAAVTPRTFLIDFCSRKITNFSPHRIVFVVVVVVASIIVMLYIILLLF